MTATNANKSPPSYCESLTIQFGAPKKEHVEPGTKAIGPMRHSAKWKKHWDTGQQQINNKMEMRSALVTTHLERCFFFKVSTLSAFNHWVSWRANWSRRFHPVDVWIQLFNGDIIIQILLRRNDSMPCSQLTQDYDLWWHQIAKSTSHYVNIDTCGGVQTPWKSRECFIPCVSPLLIAHLLCDMQVLWMHFLVVIHKFALLSSSISRNYLGSLNQCRTLIQALANVNKHSSWYCKCGNWMKMVCKRGF